MLVINKQKPTCWITVSEKNFLNRPLILKSGVKLYRFGNTNLTLFHRIKKILLTVLVLQKNSLIFAALFEEIVCLLFNS